MDKNNDIIEKLKDRILCLELELEKFNNLKIEIKESKEFDKKSEIVVIKDLIAYPSINIMKDLLTDVFTSLKDNFEFHFSNSHATYDIFISSSDNENSFLNVNIKYKKTNSRFQRKIPLGLLKYTPVVIELLCLKNTLNLLDKGE